MGFHSARVLGVAFFLSISGSVHAAETFVDANGDGIADQKQILDAIHGLAAKGVTFNDEDPWGHKPVFRNGLYQMCCIDLILVAYRAAGYDLCKAVSGGTLIRKDMDYLNYTGGANGARSVSTMSAYTRRSPDWKWGDLTGIDPMDKNWIPAEPFQPGEMVFIDYTCTHGRQNSDRHSGIVTEVDPASGRPTRIAQISTYNKNEGLQEVSVATLFNMYCRRLTGRARPASWAVPERVVVAEAPKVEAKKPLAKPVKTAEKPVKTARKDTRRSHRSMVSTNKKPRRKKNEAGD